MKDLKEAMPAPCCKSKHHKRSKQHLDREDSRGVVWGTINQQVSVLSVCFKNDKDLLPSLPSTKVIILLELCC